MFNRLTGIQTNKGYMDVWLIDGRVELDLGKDFNWSLWIEGNDIHNLVLALQKAERILKKRKRHLMYKEEK